MMILVAAGQHQIRDKCLNDSVLPAPDHTVHTCSFSPTKLRGFEIICTNIEKDGKGIDNWGTPSMKVCGYPSGLMLAKFLHRMHASIMSRAKSHIHNGE